MFQTLIFHRNVLLCNTNFVHVSTQNLNNKYMSQEYMNLKYVFTLSTVYSVFIEVPLYHYPSNLHKEYKCMV